MPVRHFNFDKTAVLEFFFVSLQPVSPKCVMCRQLGFATRLLWTKIPYQTLLVYRIPILTRFATLFTIFFCYFLSFFCFFYKKQLLKIHKIFTKFDNKQPYYC